MGPEEEHWIGDVPSEHEAIVNGLDQSVTSEWLVQENATLRKVLINSRFYFIAHRHQNDPRRFVKRPETLYRFWSAYCQQVTQDQIDVGCIVPIESKAPLAIFSTHHSESMPFQNGSAYGTNDFVVFDY
jgi:hypothetical protein